MCFRSAAVLALLAVTPLRAEAAEPYPFVGVYSVLDRDMETHYGMDKFTCLASLIVQRQDGSYTAYHIDMDKLGKEGKAEFHPYEQGQCDYSQPKHMDTCKVSKSNWGENEYYSDHQGEKDGVIQLANVFKGKPGEVSFAAMRKCPFDETKIKPHLSDVWLNYSDDDFSWVIYRYLPFNPDLAVKIRADLGIGP